mgnify:CR=1 FL=1
MRDLMFKFILTASLMTSSAWAVQTDMLCEFGQTLSVAGDHRTDNAIHVLWRGRVYPMERVRTSTGAHRFEHGQSGLVWIDIPTKSMLLDARRGTPVVNDCKVVSKNLPRR